MAVAPKKPAAKRKTAAKTNKKPHHNKGKTREELFGDSRIVARLDRSGYGHHNSKFRPEYGQIVYEMSEQGYSMAAIAGEIGVHKTTLYDWRKQYPEFDAMCLAATGKRQKAWETKLIESRNSASVTSAMFALRPIDPENFDVKKEMELNVNDGKRQINWEDLPVDKLLQLQAIIQGHVASKKAITADYEETDD